MMNICHQGTHALAVAFQTDRKGKPKQMSQQDPQYEILCCDQNHRVSYNYSRLSLPKPTNHRLLAYTLSVMVKLITQQRTPTSLTLLHYSHVIDFRSVIWIIIQGVRMMVKHCNYCYANTQRVFILAQVTPMICQQQAWIVNRHTWQAYSCFQLQPANRKEVSHFSNFEDGHHLIYETNSVFFPCKTGQAKTILALPDYGLLSMPVWSLYA